MKIKKGYVLREIAGSHIVIPVGSRVVDFKGIMTLSETGAFLWGLLQEDVSEEFLLENLIDVYYVEHTVAYEDLCSFLEMMRNADVFEEPVQNCEDAE